MDCSCKSNLCTSNNIDFLSTEAWFSAAPNAALSVRQNGKWKQVEKLFKKVPRKTPGPIPLCYLHALCIGFMMSLWLRASRALHLSVTSWTHAYPTHFIRGSGRPGQGVIYGRTGQPGACQVVRLVRRLGGPPRQMLKDGVVQRR